MRANNTKPGIGRYTSLREQYKREAQEKQKPKPRYNPPKFPYTYDKGARVSFLESVHTIPFKEIVAPKAIDVPLPEKLLSKIQLSQIFGSSPMYIGCVDQSLSIFSKGVQ